MIRDLIIDFISIASIFIAVLVAYSWLT